MYLYKPSVVTTVLVTQLLKGVNVAVTLLVASVNLAL